MASIRKRGSTWQAQVRREGSPPLSKTFATKADAQVWARDQRGLSTVLRLQRPHENSRVLPLPIYCGATVIQ